MGLPLLKGCCCFRLSTGATVIAVLSLVLTIVNLFTVITGSSFYSHRDFLINIGYSSDAASHRALTFSIIYGISNLIHLVLVSLLMHGILKARIDLMKVYIIYGFISLGLMVIGGIAFVVMIGGRSYAILCTALSIGIFFQLFLLWVIHSYRMEIKEQSGHGKMRLEETD